MLSVLQVQYLKMHNTHFEYLLRSAIDQRQQMLDGSDTPADRRLRVNTDRIRRAYTKLLPHAARCGYHD